MNKFDVLLNQDDIARAEIKRRLLEHDRLAPENDRLQAINDELLAALEEYLDWHEANFVLPSGNFEDPDQMGLAKAARAAIAKAKAGKE